MFVAVQRTPKGTTLAARLEHFSMPEPNSGCWLWTGGWSHQGYGSVHWRSRKHPAHRLSWELANGKSVPKGMVVMHKCDTRCCVNPSHLTVGTQAENLADMRRKGRDRWSAPRVQGARHGMAKLTNEQVLAIRKDARKASLIAADYRLTARHVRDIRNRNCWEHI